MSDYEPDNWIHKLEEETWSQYYEGVDTVLHLIKNEAKELGIKISYNLRTNNMRVRPVEGLEFLEITFNCREDLNLFRLVLGNRYDEIIADSPCEVRFIISQEI